MANYGDTRAEIEDNLRKDGLGTMTDEQFDKCKYLERKSQKEFGGVIFINEAHIDAAEEIEE
jgi:hypothetical protein